MPVGVYAHKTKKGKISVHAHVFANEKLFSYVKFESDKPTKPEVLAEMTIEKLKASKLKEVLKELARKKK